MINVNQCRDNTFNRMHDLRIQECQWDIEQVYAYRGSRAMQHQNFWHVTNQLTNEYGYGAYV